MAEQISSRSLLAAVARRANLRNDGPNLLRHTFCSHLAMRGGKPTWLQKVAGHKDLATTQKYMHLSPETSDEAIKLLEAQRPLALGHYFGGRTQNRHSLMPIS